jgi:hypothetical protein
MTSGFDRCTIINITEGEVRNQKGKYKDIEELQPEEACKYLGIPQANQPQLSQDLHCKVQEKGRKNFEHQVICEKPHHSTQQVAITSPQFMTIWRWKVLQSSSKTG